MDKKTNTFRKEVEASKLSPAEEMNRNQAVQLVALRSWRAMSIMAVDHLNDKLINFHELLGELHSMPDCFNKTATIAGVDSQIEQHEKAIEASQFNGVSEMTLDALERLAVLESKPSLLVEEQGVN